MTGVRTAIVVLAGVVVALLGWSWLGGGDGGDDPAAGDAASADDEPRQPAGTVTVLAAASLTESFTAISDELARSHPEIEVVLSFGPSSQLVEQVLSGAPADVLATADTDTMAKAADAGVIDGEASVFAANTPALVVPAGNPGGVTGLADLEREDLRVAVCEPHVPCGVAAERLMSQAGVEPAPDTLATDVKEALALVTLGEVDAAMVFQTDAVSAGEAVRVVPVAEAESVVNHYPVAILDGARHPAAARAVVDAVTGEMGRRVLTESGFLVP